MWDTALSKVVWHELLKEGEDAALPEGVAAIHQLVSAPHETTLNSALNAAILQTSIGYVRNNFAGRAEHAMFESSAHVFLNTVEDGCLAGVVKRMVQHEAFEQSRHPPCCVALKNAPDHTESWLDNHEIPFKSCSQAK